MNNIYVGIYATEVNYEKDSNYYMRPRMNSEDSNDDEAQWVVRVSTNEVNGRPKIGITKGNTQT